MVFSFSGVSGEKNFSQLAFTSARAAFSSAGPVLCPDCEAAGLDGSLAVDEGLGLAPPPPLSLHPETARTSAVATAATAPKALRVPGRPVRTVRTMCLTVPSKALLLLMA
ncbi:hypothetical protein GCM10012280_52060 [Wenjunlia tyrosinilytica]|uniref:Uncharacterized protein n=1 Tax=Wenjunlia tyrosinilytica TaxID=1544741 RepID=A0A918E157_9ACTN|nr:hypothetical protein GCM10012280_52060 [Wenjunlia tyrosinilytica]